MPHIEDVPCIFNESLVFIVSPLRSLFDCKLWASAGFGMALARSLVTNFASRGNRPRLLLEANKPSLNKAPILAFARPSQVVGSRCRSTAFRAASHRGDGSHGFVSFNTGFACNS